MAIVNWPYASVNEYRAVAGNSDDGADILIAAHLQSASDLYNKRVGQWFYKTDAVTARTFKAKYSDRLDLDYAGDCPGIATATGLLIKVDTDADESFSDETAWLATDYRLWPLNAQAAGVQIQEPYRRIEVKPSGAQRFIPGGLVEVTAVFGWPEIPQTVKDDVLEICRIWRRESPAATGRITELESFVTESPMVMSLLKRGQEAYVKGPTF